MKIQPIEIALPTGFQAFYPAGGIANLVERLPPTSMAVYAGGRLLADTTVPVCFVECPPGKEVSSK